ncbi:MAG: hypothetical protein KatS3mg105_0306 [Gemmatales bacterium]|nr:MAG: hypothetical protein KatS3mg105_0306 [Gemmatales bacterium]
MIRVSVFLASSSTCRCQDRPDFGVDASITSRTRNALERKLVFESLVEGALDAVHDQRARQGKRQNEQRCKTAEQPPEIP